MEVLSPAKINWCLRVLGRRADGYHDLETLFQTISLSDNLIVEPAARIEVRCSDRSIPTDERNLVWKAARAMQVRLGAPAVSVSIDKRIPAGGGLGGGSSNAAAALRAIDDLFSLRTPPELLGEIALELGSDVPFFLLGGTAYGSGRGEVLVPLPAIGGVALLLVVSKDRVLTSEAFALLSSTRGSPSRPLGLERYRAMVESDFFSHREAMVNDFEPPVFARFPKLAQVKRRLDESGAVWAAMTGSGSTIVGAFESAAVRDRASEQFGDCKIIEAETVGN